LIAFSFSNPLSRLEEALPEKEKDKSQAVLFCILDGTEASSPVATDTAGDDAELIASAPLLRLEALSERLKDRSRPLFFLRPNFFFWGAATTIPLVSKPPSFLELDDDRIPIFFFLCATATPASEPPSFLKLGDEGRPSVLGATVSLASKPAFLLALDDERRPFAAKMATASGKSNRTNRHCSCENSEGVGRV
jgi:hypothetical protein